MARIIKILDTLFYLGICLIILTIAAGIYFAPSRYYKIVKVEDNKCYVLRDHDTLTYNAVYSYEHSPQIGDSILLRYDYDIKYLLTSN